ncbi:DsbA family oxidoreductase [Dyadobacter sp. NIV53]|uniref:DsbA family oxidoreductase n=1 Tax=Dyadobacter sp. NIV53 TaxID=2861765 RepID=UPI001C8855EB|nr:DsbA family oxidoreductase [Dyadobacter sp. NIV53]
MKIEIWSDIACPYCYVGKSHLDTALQQFEFRDQVEVLLHSFELEPDIAENSGESQHAAVMRKYRQSDKLARETLDRATSAGKAVGVVIDFDKVITTNTFKAHRLIRFAAMEGKENEMKDRLFKAYFSEGKNISDISVLKELASETGIDARLVLENDLFSAQVRKDEKDARLSGIRSVPFFLFDSKYSVSGAQPISTFLEVLEKVWSENVPLRTGTQIENGCSDGVCNVNSL